MQRWTRFLAPTVALLLVAGPVWAQGTTGAAGSTDSDKAATGGTTSGSPSAGGSASGATGTDSGQQGAASGTTGTTDSGTAKTDGGMQGDRAARAGGQNREQVKAVQQALKDKGHDPGVVDGIMGPKTQAALRDYQKQEGLQVTGRLDQATMAQLGVEGQAGGAGTSPAASPQTEPGKSGDAGKTSGTTGGAPSASPGGGDASQQQTDKQGQKQ